MQRASSVAREAVSVARREADPELGSAPEVCCLLLSMPEHRHLRSGCSMRCKAMCPSAAATANQARDALRSAGYDATAWASLPDTSAARSTKLPGRATCARARRVFLISSLRPVRCCCRRRGHTPPKPSPSRLRTRQCRAVPHSAAAALAPAPAARLPRVQLSWQARCFRQPRHVRYQRRTARGAA